MAKPTQTRSAPLTRKVGAFVGVFAALVAVFEPTTAFAFALVAVTLLARD